MQQAKVMRTGLASKVNTLSTGDKLWRDLWRECDVKFSWHVTWLFQGELLLGYYLCLTGGLSLVPHDTANHRVLGTKHIRTASLKRRIIFLKHYTLEQTNEKCIQNFSVRFTGEWVSQRSCLGSGGVAGQTKPVRIYTISLLQSCHISASSSFGFVNTSWLDLWKWR